MEFTAELIAGFLGGEVVGDKNAKVWTISKIEEGADGSLAFLANPKYEHYIYETKATIVMVNRTFEPTATVPCTMVRVDDAYACFAKLLELYAANRPQKHGLSERAAVAESAVLGQDCYVGEFTVIADDVRIGNNVKIFPQAYIGDRVKIGDNVTINAGVKIYEDCVIGNNVIVHAGSVIGADGFGFAPNEKGEFSKIPQIGNVIIEDDVEIGANTCIDRATMGSTLIKHGVKLDNLIQVGHNVIVGESTVCAAQVGIAGSTKIGRNCMMGGQVGIAGHLVIGDRVQLASKSGVSNNIADDQIHMGYPSLPGSKYHRANAIFRNLPDLSMKVSMLEKQLKKLVEAKSE